MSNDNSGNYSGESNYYKQGPPNYNQAPPPNYNQTPPPNYSQGPQTGDWSTSHNFGPAQDEKLPDQPSKPTNIWRIIATVLAATTVLFAFTTFLSYNHILNPPAKVSTSKPQVSAPTLVAGQPTAPPQATTASTTLTPTLTAQSSTPVVASDYSALKPGPGCDINGGTWTPQGLGNITCGTTVSAGAQNIRGYLYLQLPNNKAFSPNNTIGVISNFGYGGQCVGLDEQDANRGFLAEYCYDGSWAIYTVSSDGTIVQTLDKNITSTRQSEDISLTLNGTILSFSIDNEMHKINSISPIHPIKVAITYYNGSITTNNFSYTILPS